jgi:hypothetical protein
MIMGVSVFVLVKETAETIKRFADVAAMALAVPSGGLVTVAQLVFLGVYLATMIIALIKMINVLFENILQSKKYKLGMLVRTHFVRACQYLKLDFESSILDVAPYNNLTIIPRKTVIDGEKDERKSNIKFKGHYDGTFADFIKDMEQYFNAKVRVIDGILYLERVDFFNKQADYKLPNINLSRSPYKYNTYELDSNLFIKYQLDSSELNTYDEYDGTSVQVTTQQKVVNDRQKVMLKRLNYKNIPFALAKRKTELNFLENLLNELATSILNFLISAVNVIPGIDIPKVDNVVNRIGWLKLSNDFIGVQKIAIVEDSGFISSQNRLLTSADYLYEHFHVVSTPNDNQYKLYKEKDIPLCCDDYLKIKNNNVITTYSGDLARVDSLVWNPHNETARISFRVKTVYTNNLTRTKVVDGR